MNQAAPARPPEDTLQAEWFDGRQARSQPVRIWLHAGSLHLQAEDGRQQAWPHGAIEWPEATRHGQRVIHLPDGASLCVADALAFDTWRARHGHRRGWVERMQQNWRASFAALALLLACVAALYVWGVPWVSAQLAAAVPATIESEVGERALGQLRSGVLKPSRHPAAVRQLWQERLEAALAQAYPDEPAVPWTLHLAGGGALGANALALPGGHIVLTDELLELLQDADDAVLGVLAHEHGHVRRRHGLQALVRLGLVSAFGALLFGDFSAVIGLVPALLANLDYSRDAEREADEDAARVLIAAGRDPARMALLFERLARERGRTALPIAFATHPGDEERVRFFRDAAGRTR